MKKMIFEIIAKEKKIEWILKKAGKLLLTVAAFLNKVLLNTVLYISTLFESEIQYGGSAVDNEILERIHNGREQNEFQE